MTCFWGHDELFGIMTAKGEPYNQVPANNVMLQQRFHNI